MASDEKQLGNTSVDSKDSGGGGSQKSMLELLTITDAAVKALNKSTSSHGSKKSQHSDQLRLSTHSDRSAKSADSGHSRSTVSSQQISDRSIKSADLHQNVGERSGHNGQLDSDRSLRSQLSQASGHSTRSYQSGQSGHSGQLRSDRDIKLSQPLHDTSHDSGVISKTQTVSEEKSKSRGVTLTAPTDDHSSDVSTTASDVLIRSTLDKSERSILAEGHNGVNGNGSSSLSSKCSRTSFGVENFNSTGPQKVKISKKHLREIKPPFEDGSPTSSASSDGKVPSALLSRTGKQISKSGHQKKGAEKEAITSSNDSNGDKFPAGKSFPVGIDTAEQFKVDKVRKSAEKAYEDINMVPKTKSRPNGTHVVIDDKLVRNPQSTTASSRGGEVKVNVVKEKTTEPAKNDTKITDEDILYRSTPKYYVERHTPQKSQPRIANGRKEEEIPEKRNLLQDLEDSVEIITAHARDSSASSSQPEIVTVPERIVTVSAKSSLSSASASSDIPAKSTPPVETCHSAGFKLRDDRGCLWDEKEKLLDDSTTIPPALNRHQMDDDRDGIREAESRPLPARFQWFSRQAHGHGLQQGAPVNGPEAPDKQKDEDVHISDFKLTEKQRMARETFARRQGGPIRRVVQPHIVSHDSKASATSNTGEPKSQPTLGQANDQVLTVAAAASAAVAATQPFVKAQQDMELKMAEVLARINELQSRSSEKHLPETEMEKERIIQLERQLADMTEKRIEYMERLQEQQMAMQAKLLSMTRDSTYARPYHPRSYSPESNLTSAPVANKAFSKTTVSRHPHSRDNYQKSSVLDLEESDSPLDTPAPRARAPRPTFYDNSDIEYRIGKARSPNAKTRSPKSKSPQRRPQSPARQLPDRGILHQILASAESPTRNGSPNIRTRLEEECESPNVRKAKTLIEDLSHIKEQVKGLVEEKERWQPSAKGSSTEKPTNVNISHTGPSPLDSYLYFPQHSSASPYKSVPDLSFSKINAPVLPGFKEAESILRQVQQNRGFLESNFEAVMRARQEVEVYSMLEAVYNDSTDQEKTRIKKMVDKSIQKLRREVEREVTDDMVISEIRKKGASIVPGAVKIPEPVPASKPANRFGIKGRVQQPKVEQKPEVKKPSAAAAKRPAVGAKENVHKFYRPPPKKKSVFEDEETMTRIYGKASYQKGRTTVKDPYLHFQNMAKQKAPRPMGHAEVKGTEMMSSKTQTVSGGVRQFYFNPTTGMYIPIASAADAAPIPGQLIPMAVPLGGPRMDSGLTVPSSMTSTHVTFSQGHIPQVTADGNVSMVSMGMEDDGKMRPELGKQVLPAVDIDTDISEMSEIVSEEVLPSVPAPRSPEAKPKKHVQIVTPRDTPNKIPARSAGKAHYEVVYHEDSSATEVDEEKTEEDSITISHPTVTHSNHQNHDSVSSATEMDREKKEEDSITISHPTVTHSNHQNHDSNSSATEVNREKKEEDSITISHPTVTHSNHQNHVSSATEVDREKKEEDSITISHPTVTHSNHQNHDSVSSAKKPFGKKKEEDSITISNPTVTHSYHQNHDSDSSATEVDREKMEEDSITISHPAVTHSNHQNHDSVKACMTHLEHFILRVSLATEVDREKKEEDSITISHPTVTHSNHQNHDSISAAKKPDGEKKEEDSMTISHRTVTHSIHQNHDSVSSAKKPDGEKKEEDSMTISHQNHDSVTASKKPDGKKKEEDSMTISHPTVTHSIHQNHDSITDDSGSLATEVDRKKKEEYSTTLSLPVVTQSNHKNHDFNSSAKQPEREKKEEDSISISHPAVTHSYHQNHDSDDTLVDEDADVETATGLELPGYQPEEVPEVQYNGPSFPPKLPSAERQLTSDLIAEDIRRRDLLQNKASEWIEQELMARIISELYPLRDTDEPHEISHVVSEESEDSMAEEREKSMFVMDTIGHRGMQLFVDAGCPVDNTLVNRLIEEVLKEKVRTMLGQRPEAEDYTHARQQDEGPQWEEPVSEEISEVSVRRSVVSTPEPTPRASPRHSPPHRVSPAPTPLASPPPGTPRVREEVFEPPELAPVVRQPVVLPAEPESEPESSVSYDIQEELARLADKLRPNIDASASIESRHDVATPLESPSPEPEPLMTTRPLTPPDLSPRSVHEEPFVMPQNMVPAGASLDQTPSRISKTKTESPKSATSPQVTEMAEEELAEDQPKAVVFTVAETQTDKLAETREKSRSPSPTKSRTPSESSYTESSSISDTFNECVSEGQWLINKSDGEVADFPIDEVAVRQRMLRMSQKRVDVSSASTWKDIDDVDLDQETDASKSEGEFLYRTDFPPEKDPVLDMLARLQSAGPQFGMYHMSQRQVTDVLNTTGKSEGEVLRVSAASQPYQHIPERETIHVAPKRSKSPKSPRTRSPEGAVMPQRGLSSPRKGSASQKRSQSPVYRTQSPTRVSFEDMLSDQPQRSVSPTRGILKRSSSFDGQPVRDDFQFPVRDSGRSQTPTGRSQTASGRMMQGERQPQAKGMIGAGGRSMSPGKSGMRRPIKSSTMPESRGSGSRMLNVRTGSEDYRDSLENTGGPSYYSGEYSARNMTPDQMNVDALIQSGYLSQSFSQSENGRQTGQSSVRNSADLRQSRDSAGQRSLGYSYGTDGSLSMSELQRLATDGTGKLKMSLTIPGTEAEDSELSEIDITDGGNTQ